MLNRPKMTEERIQQVKDIIEEHPTWHRTKISQYICEVWDWRVPGGTLKDISCRDMLYVLEKAGRITLPPSRRHVTGKRRSARHIDHDTTQICGSLRQLQPISVEIAGEDGGLNEFISLIDTYHYLGYGGTVGENMKYIARDGGGRIVAALLFGSAAWSCRDRDAFLGWDAAQRAKGLYRMTNNTRFLVMPWVRVAHLASYTLSRVARRIRRDWEIKYGHAVDCLETFVERGRFAGTCYKAANWVYVGQTTGRGRDDRYKTAALPIKDIYLYPLVRGYRALLRAEQ